MEELLKAIGYPASAVVVFVFLAYVWRKIFEKTLDVLVEDRKAELSRETERLKTTLGIEAETYRLAAQKRFECMFDLWESSEALFEDTDFSDIGSIQTGLERLESSVKSLNKYSVLIPQDTVVSIKSYLEKVGKVLTNSEKEFDEHAITSDKISSLLKILASPLSIVNPAAGIAAEISAAVVPSVSEILEKTRQKAAIEARQQLEDILRKEFGVWIVEKKALVIDTEAEVKKANKANTADAKSRAAD